VKIKRGIIARGAGFSDHLHYGGSLTVKVERVKVNKHLEVSPCEHDVVELKICFSKISGEDN